MGTPRQQGAAQSLAKATLKYKDGSYPICLFGLCVKTNEFSLSAALLLRMLHIHFLRISPFPHKTSQALANTLMLSSAFMYRMI